MSTSWKRLNFLQNIWQFGPIGPNSLIIYTRQANFETKSANTCNTYNTSRKFHPDLLHSSLWKQICFFKSSSHYQKKDLYTR